jgi:hypothetical protein
MYVCIYVYICLHVLEFEAGHTTSFFKSGGPADTLKWYVDVITLTMQDMSHVARMRVGLRHVFDV